MSPWTFDVRFPRGTHLTFGSLTFVAGEDGSLRMLPPGPAPEHIAPTHGQDQCRPATSSTPGGACAGLDSCARLYTHTTKLVRGISVVMSILRPSAGASSSSSSAVSLDQDSSDDYPEIGINTYRGSTGRVA
jgi:hypothetical protein